MSASAMMHKGALVICGIGVKFVIRHSHRKLRGSPNGALQLEATSREGVAVRPLTLILVRTGSHSCPVHRRTWSPPIKFTLPPDPKISRYISGVTFFPPTKRF